MRYVAALAGLSLLVSSAVYAQSAQSPSTPPSVSSSKSSDEAPSQPQLSQKFIRQIQRRLQQQGVYQGQPNGEWDQATADALEQFQQEHGLPAEGELDGATLMALMRPQRMQPPGMQEGMEGSSSGSSSMSGSRPMFRAYERGYQEGFSQGFATAIQQGQQQ